MTPLIQPFLHLKIVSFFNFYKSLNFITYNRVGVGSVNLVPIRMKLNLVGYQETNLLYTGTRTLVYRALRICDHKPVIIKVLRNHHPHFHELVQFRNQYIITCHLQHPTISHPLALERYANGYALVMADHGAVALSHYWQTSTRSLIEFLKIALQLAEALHYLNQQRIIHKDIKPSNIIIHPENRQVKLIDFSISSLLPKEQQQLQNPNILEGTLAYISPEQTGRMNRGIDYRTDFYSLGVTFFELLTGKLPFSSHDPMELLHCHIAQTVQFPSEEIMPEMLQKIVLKLMAKNAEDRYQSALGLKFDLERCLQQWETTGTITPFNLGEQDRSDRFLIPEKLYGRETEVKMLLKAFERVTQGSTEILLVAGFSGIGKTAVVNEVHKPIVQQRGYFIKGKFDQFNRNIPFSAFVQAFRDLMGQLLAESDPELATWKTKILNALGENAQVIIDVIPELERILGQQPPVAELSSNAAQNRFNLLFNKFVRVFTTPNHPLVVFLDDLQWADSASLNLLKLLIDESETGYLLVLGAYRDNEVFAAHPLRLTLEEIQKQGATINTLTLSPLTQIDLNQLVADTLLCSTDIASPLSQLVYQKTQGNPFFSTQFLKGLYEEGWIQFETDLGYWQCDLTEVRQLALTDDVVEFMAQQLQKLPSATQQILQLAACMGNPFDLYTLALVSEISIENAANALWKALQDGLILPQSEVYKFYLNPLGIDDTKTNIENITYRFLHDRVQQAAYSLIPAHQQQAIHYKIGKQLLEYSSDAEREDRLFEIVTHLNGGKTLITEAKEREKLAELNLMVGCKAQSSTAHAAALEYLMTGIELLTSDCWQTQYQLTLALYSNATEAAYLNAEFEQVENFAEIVLKQTHTLSEQVKIYGIKIQVLISQNQLPEALEYGLQILRLVGIEFPKEPSQADIGIGLEKIQQLWNNLDGKELTDLPRMTEPDSLVAMQILLNISATAYFVSPILYILIVFQQVNLSLTYGNTLASTYAYGAYGLILCGVVGNIPLGYQFGQNALNLLQQLNAKELQCKVHFLFNCLIRHWQEHLRTTIEPLQTAYFLGLETGDLEFASYSALEKTRHLYWAGEELSTVEQDLTRFMAGVKKIKRSNTLNYYQILQQAIAQLRKPKETSLNLQQQTVVLEMFEDHSDLNGIGYYYCHQMILYYLFEEHLKAVETAKLAEQYLEALAALFFVPIFYFYDSLSQLAIYDHTSPSQQQNILIKVSANQEKMQTWANHAPMNHLHKFEMVEAEKYRVLNQKLEAIECYERAITAAKENGYLQEEALANELAAKFYLNWGKDKVAATYMQEAYYCYARWGSPAKIYHLEKTYPQLLTPILQQQKLDLNSSLNLEDLTQSLLSITQTKTSIGLCETLDLASLLQAAQTISSTIELNQLLADISRIILMNSGAQKAVLLIPEQEEWQLRASAELISDGTVEVRMRSQRLTIEDQLPIRLIHYVQHAQKAISINAAKPEITGILDDLEQQKKPQSVLCVPLLNHQNVVAILYLEHPTTKDVFTTNRQIMVQFLCTQAAIALQNAQLYEQAQQAQLQLVQSEKMSALGNLVAGIAHEINNPTAFLQGNIKPAQDYVNDLLNFIDLLLTKCPRTDREIENKMEAIDWEFIQEDLPKLLASMNLGVERIRSISQSLRTFSRQDKDYKIAFDIHEGIDSTLLILQHRTKAQEKRPKIEIIKEYQIIPAIQCFPSQLNQVFMNILANAIDALEEGNQGKTYGEIEVDPNCIIIRTSRLNETQIQIQIEDNGCGMNLETQNRIFEQGFTTKAVGKGTGLGMAIAYQIITVQHRGLIRCDSQLGKGTTFTITLPI